MSSGIHGNKQGPLPGTSSENDGTTHISVKSFASFKTSKAKEWKSRVTKSNKEEEKKSQDDAVNLGFMERNEKDEALNTKRGKWLSLRGSPIASYVNYNA